MLHAPYEAGRDRKARVGLVTYHVFTAFISNPDFVYFTSRHVNSCPYAKFLSGRFLIMRVRDC